MLTTSLAFTTNSPAAAGLMMMVDSTDSAWLAVAGECVLVFLRPTKTMTTRGAVTFADGRRVASSAAAVWVPIPLTNTSTTLRYYSYLPDSATSRVEIHGFKWP